jgi:hypothetical protein
MWQKIDRRFAAIQQMIGRATAFMLKDDRDLVKKLGLKAIQKTRYRLIN